MARREGSIVKLRYEKKRMATDVTTTRRVMMVERNGKRFLVETQRGPKGLWRATQYYSQRLFNPKQRRLYRFYNRVQPSFWRSFAEGEFEPETLRAFDAFLDMEHTYIDIGAWIGPTVLYGSQLAEHCYAIEPDPVAYKLLRTNIQLNPDLCKRITLFHGCIADACGVVRLSNVFSAVGGDSRSSLLSGRAKVAWEVPSTTLQRFMEDHQIENCNFIKMDVEGGETVILPNIATFLASEKPTLHLSLHPRFFEKPSQDMKKILEILAPYSHLLDKAGKPLDPATLLADDRFLACDYLIATERLPKVLWPKA